LWDQPGPSMKFPGKMVRERLRWFAGQARERLRSFAGRAREWFLSFVTRAKERFWSFAGWVRRRVYWALALIFILLVPRLTRELIWAFHVPEPDPTALDERELQAAQRKIRGEIAVLDRRLAARKPRSYYLVINSAANEFTLYRGEQVIRKDKCSTGSYILLRNGEEQQWMFSTPKGEFRVQGKTVSPVWKKPDWAFVEEGLPVPPPDHYTRYEYGVLGDYALSLGHGYLIHGTLYQRFLGLPVTHGCIRMNDESLELVYNSLEVGSKVYIF
jgi:L,D-transpeptidase ErfK/SrfK